MKRNFWRLRLVILVFIVLAAAITPGILVRAQGNPITLLVDAGFDTYFRGNRLTPMLITASNRGPDVSGDLVLEGASERYATHIDLPGGSTKQVFLYGLLTSFAPTVTIDLVGDAGPLASTQSKVRAVADNELLYALVTDPSQSSQLSVNFNFGTHRNEVNWRLENIPETAEALRALDIMVITGVDTGQLTSQQRLAVQGWVLDGGHLIVTGGPSWQKTGAAFSDLLPFKPTDTTTLASISSLAAFAGQSGDKLDAGNNPIIVARGTPTSDATILAQDSNTPLFIRHAYGDGLVDYLAIDPALEPYVSWPHVDNFWNAVLTTSGIKPSWIQGVTDDQQALNVANFIKGLRLPDVAQLCGFLGIYIILIGPLNYLILKRLGRRELAWITIPVIIVGYSILAYITGFSLRGTQPTLNRLALVRVWPGQSTARVDGIVGVLSPRRATYTLNAKQGLALHIIQGDYNIGSATGTVTIQETPGQTLDFSAHDINVNAGLIAAFTVGGTVKTQPMNGSATITLGDGTSTAQSTISARVTNTTGQTLQDAVIIFPGGSRVIGEFVPGAVQSINNMLLVAGSAASPQWTGNGQNNATTNSYIYNTTTNNCGYIDPTIVDIISLNHCIQHEYYGYYSPGSSDPQVQEWQRRQMLLDSILSGNDPNGGRGMNVYVVGWTNNSPLDVGLGESSYIAEDTTLYLYQIPVSIKPAASVIEVPTGLMTWAIDPASQRTDVTPYNLNLASSDSATFLFTPLVPLKSVSKLSIQIDVQNGFFNQGSIALWNWNTGIWEDLAALQPTFTLTATNTIDNAQRFANQDGVIRVQIQGSSPSSFATVTSGITYQSIDVNLYGQPGQ